MNTLRKLHRHPYKEFELASQLRLFEVIVDAEFKKQFRYHRDIPGDEGHIIVKLCEFLEQTVPPSDLGDIVRTGTHVRVTTSSPLHPEYVGMSGVVSEWICNSDISAEVMYVIEVNGLPLAGWALRDCFEIIDQTSNDISIEATDLTDLDLDFCRCQILPNGINGALRPVKNTSKQFIYRIVYAYEQQGGKVPMGSRVVKCYLNKYDSQGNLKFCYVPYKYASRKHIYEFVMKRKEELRDRYNKYLKQLYN